MDGFLAYVNTTRTAADKDSSVADGAAIRTCGMSHGQGWCHLTARMIASRGDYFEVRQTKLVTPRRCASRELTLVGYKSIHHPPNGLHGVLNT